MSGHNKWSQIKHKKEITDAKKSKIFSKLAKYISVEAKLSLGKDSPGLRRAIEKARKANMPSSNIEKAIKKASEPSSSLENIMYEAYGPSGTGIIIEVLTENKNRTAQEIKHILSKNNAVLGSIGSVIWNFKKEIKEDGLIWTPINTIDLIDDDLILLEKLVNELEDSDDIQEIFTNAS